MVTRAKPFALHELFWK